MRTASVPDCDLRCVAMRRHRDTVSRCARAAGIVHTGWWTPEPMRQGAAARTVSQPMCGIDGRRKGAYRIPLLATLPSVNPVADGAPFGDHDGAARAGRAMMMAAESCMGRTHPPVRA